MDHACCSQLRKICAQADYSGGWGCEQVCGVYGSWHLGQLQVGLSRAVRLAQCRSARITALEALPLQIDGEPWSQPPATLDISLKGQARCTPMCIALHMEQ